MLPFKLVYDDCYDLNLGPHVFPSQKYRMVHDQLLADGIADADDFVTPEPITSSPSACASVPNVHKLLSPACGDETLLDTAPPPTAWKTTSLTTNTNFDKLQPLACGDKTLPTCVPHAKSYIC